MTHARERFNLDNGGRHARECNTFLRAILAGAEAGDEMIQINKRDERAREKNRYF